MAAYGDDWSWYGKGSADPWSGKGADAWPGKGDSWVGDQFAGKGKADAWSGKGEAWSGADAWPATGSADAWAGKGDDGLSGTSADVWAGKGADAWAGKGWPGPGGDAWAADANSIGNGLESEAKRPRITFVNPQAAALAEQGLPAGIRALAAARGAADAFTAYPHHVGSGPTLTIRPPAAFAQFPGGVEQYARTIMLASKPTVMKGAALAEQIERVEQKEDSDDDVDDFGRRKGKKKKGAVEEATEKKTLTKAERQKAALERLRAPRKVVEKPKEEAKTEEDAGVDQAAATPAVGEDGDAQGKPIASVMRHSQTPIPDANTAVRQASSQATPDGARWICINCGFANRNQNARCGGNGTLGCKQLRY